MKRSGGVATVIAMLVFLTSCTSEPVAQPQRWTPPATATETVASTAVDATSSTVSTTASTADTASLSEESQRSSTAITSQPSPLGTSTPANPTTATAPTGPWPADFSVDQVNWTEEAWTRYLELESLFRQAEKDPTGQDWESLLGSYAQARPYTIATSSLDLLRAEGLRAETTSRRTLISVQQATQARVDYTVCLEVEDSQLLDAGGAVVQSGEASSSLLAVASVREFQTDWIVVEENEIAQQC